MSVIIRASCLASYQLLFNPHRLVVVIALRLGKAGGVSSLPYIQSVITTRWKVKPLKLTLTSFSRATEADVLAVTHH